MKESIDKYTALHMASFSGNKRILNLLLNTFNDEGRNECTKECKYFGKLIDYLTKVNGENCTAEHIAESKGHKEIVRLLTIKYCQAFNTQSQQDQLNDLIYWCGRSRAQELWSGIFHKK